MVEYRYKCRKCGRVKVAQFINPLWHVSRNDAAGKVNFKHDRWGDACAPSCAEATTEKEKE